MRNLFKHRKKTLINLFVLKEIILNRKQKNLWVKVSLVSILKKIHITFRTHTDTLSQKPITSSLKHSLSSTLSKHYKNQWMSPHKFSNKRSCFSKKPKRKLSTTFWTVAKPYPTYQKFLKTKTQPPQQNWKKNKKKFGWMKKRSKNKKKCI